MAGRGGVLMRAGATADRAARTTRVRAWAPYALPYVAALAVITAAYWAVAAVTEPLAPAVTHAGGLAGALAAGAAVRPLRHRLRNRLRPRPAGRPRDRLPAAGHESSRTGPGP